MHGSSKQKSTAREQNPPVIDTGDACIEMDPAESAAIAGLVYISDKKPGITRKQAKKGFAYFRPDGSPVTSEKELRRISSLVIPPAWKDVWISPLPQSHLQATGRDARGRKQYRYHNLWAEVRGETKFNRIVAFAKSLPEIRQRTEKDLALPGLARNKVLATVVRLLEKTLIRVGNEAYARDNGSFGLTTLRTDHVEVKGPVLKFQFRGKSGKLHHTKVQSKRLAKVVRRCFDLPGHELFQYLDDDGNPRSITSGDVNEYMLEITGESFTAKDFRTWGGTMHTVRALLELGPPTSAADAKKQIVQAVKKVAATLGNREATCRKYYIHPAVLEAYAEGSLETAFSSTERGSNANPLNTLEDDEVAVLKILSTWDEQRDETAAWSKELEARKKKRGASSAKQEK